MDIENKNESLDRDHYISKAKYLLEHAIFLLKAMIIKDEPEVEDAIAEVKNLLSKEYETLGYDYCIDKGCELDQILAEYREYKDK